MSEPTQNADLKQFLYEYVESYEELGIIMWFHRRGSVNGTATRIADETGLPAASVEEALDKLLARGLLSPSPEENEAFCFAPADATTRDAVNRLIDLYETNAIEVVGFMTANAIERVRTAGTRLFADCFRIGGPRSRG